jgi:NAD(P)H-binding
VFLTGASGFLGGHLLRELLAAGHEVWALSRQVESDAAISKQGGMPVRGELKDFASLKVALAGCEAIFRAAADTSMWKRQTAAQTASTRSDRLNEPYAAAGSLMRSRPFSRRPAKRRRYASWVSTVTVKSYQLPLADTGQLLLTLPSAGTETIHSFLPVR